MSKIVLVVDDEPHIRMLLEQTLEDLEDEGVELISASNGEDALARIRSDHPDLVLLDVMMPKLNGFQVCQAAKGDPATANTAIVLLTAKGQEFDRQRGNEVGADLYMTKPFDPDEVVRQVRRMLGLA